jgi:hypothetical protein
MFFTLQATHSPFPCCAITTLRFVLVLLLLALLLTKFVGVGLRWPLPDVSDEDSTPFSPLSCQSTGGDFEDIPDENWLSASILGQWPTIQENGKFPLVGFDFPPGYPTARLYPASSATYTLESDSSTHTIECFSRSSTASKTVECPSPFLLPTDPDNVNACVMPCPIAGAQLLHVRGFCLWSTKLPLFFIIFKSAFSTGEYNVMWISAVVPGCYGMSLNVFMALT